MLFIDFKHPVPEYWAIQAASIEAPFGEDSFVNQCFGCSKRYNANPSAVGFGYCTAYKNYLMGCN